MTKRSSVRALHEDACVHIERTCGFHVLVQQSLAGLYVIQDDSFRYINDRFLEIFACDRADVGAVEPFLAWAVVEQDRPTVRENLRKRLAREVESLRYAIQGRRKDGRPLYIEIHGRRGEYEGRPAIIGLLLDVTPRQQAVEELAREHRFISAVLDTVGALVVVLDGQGRIVRFNRECERVSGYRSDEMLGRRVWDELIPEPERQGVAEVFANLQAGHFPHHYENHWLTRHGEQRLIAWTNTVLLDAAGQVEFVIGTGLDITDRRRMEVTLRESEARLREITSELGDGIYVLDHAGHLTFMNRAAQEMLGWSESELLGLSAHESFHYQKPDGTQVPVCDCPVYKSIHSGETYRVHEDYFTRRDGTLFPVSFVSTPLHRGGEIIGSVAAFQDISERKAAQERIHHMAHHDMLTGLPNRALLGERLTWMLAQARRRSQGLAVVFMDLDGFKQVNDSLGHDVGDALLKVVAGRLKSCLRESDTVARLGGDEFVMLLADVVQPEVAAGVAEKVIEAVNRSILLNEHALHVGVSVGIALYPAHGDDSQTLMKHADWAMYQAKEAGRNDYCFYPATRMPSFRRTPESR